MKVVTAVEKHKWKSSDVGVFLAGGITDCWDWQQAVIDELASYSDTDDLIVFNPRRKNFPINDSNAAEEQIKWEHKYLHECNIFSMYFAGGESVQPICMFELGVHLTRLASVPDSTVKAAIVSIEKGYSREQDVVIQSKLALDMNIASLDANPKTHAKLIYEAYQRLAL